MKNIWTAKEIEKQHGQLIIRNDATKPFKDLAFARTVTFKVGYGKMQFGICNILTDGWYSDIANSAKEFAAYLNSDKIGYRPLSKAELLQLIDDGEQQLFY